MKVKIFTILLLFVSFSFACTAQTTGTNDKFLKTTIQNISISVPVGFEAVPGQNGFVHKGSASTLMVSEISNSPFSFSEKFFNSGNLEKDGAKITDRKEVKTTAGQDALLFTISLSITGKDNSSIEFERLVMLTGNDNTTVCIVANYPVMIKKLISEPLKTSLLSVVIN